MNDLKDSLRMKQGKMSHVKFSQKLGISDTMLKRFYKGQRDFGVASLRAIYKAYPDLIMPVLDYIFVEATNV